MWHPLAGKVKTFWSWGQWRTWGLRPPVPAMPFDWRFFLGPLCITRVTKNSPTRMTRQRRRNLQRQIRKAVRR